MYLRNVLLAPTVEPLAKYASHSSAGHDAAAHHGRLLADKFEFRVRADDAARWRRNAAGAHRTAVACQAMMPAFLVACLPRLWAAGHPALAGRQAGRCTRRLKLADVADTRPGKPASSLDTRRP